MATGRHREQCVPTHVNIRRLPRGVGVVNYMLYYIVLYCILLHYIIQETHFGQDFHPCEAHYSNPIYLFLGKTYDGHGSSP